MNTNNIVNLIRSDIIDKIRSEIQVEIHLAKLHINSEGLDLLIEDYVDFAVNNIEHNLGDKCFYYGFDDCIGTYELHIGKTIEEDTEYLRLLKCNECGRYMKIETFEDYCKKAETRELRRMDKSEECLEENDAEIKELQERITDIRERSRVLKQEIKDYKKRAALFRWK